jgi:hypothetical protein
MFKKKKNKPNKTPIDIHKELFYEYQGSECSEKNLVEDLYNEIKTHYEKQIKDEKFDIHLERIRINNSLSKYSDTTNKRNDLNKAILILYLTLVFNALLKFSESIGNEYKFLGGSQVTIFLFIIGYFFYKVIKEDEKSKTREKDLVNNISLIVLDDMENGFNENGQDKSIIENVRNKRIECPVESEIKS